MIRFLFILFLLIPGQALADYARTSLSKLMSADLILHGSIKDVGDKFITLKIHSVLKGAYNDSIVTIKKFQDWTCAMRFASYRKGQEELVFLRQEHDGKYSIIGAGDEGEIPIVGNQVYYAYSGTGLLPTKQFKLFDGGISGYKYDFELFLKAIKIYLANEEFFIYEVKRNRNFKFTKEKNPVLDQILYELKTENYH